MVDNMPVDYYESISVSYHKAQEEIIQIFKKYDFNAYVAKEILKDTMEQVELRSKIVD